MLNLLPLHNKKMIKREYKRRRAVMMLIFGAAALIMLLIFLLPTFILTKLRFEQASASNEILKEKIDSQKNKETNFTAKQKEMLTALESAKGLAHSPTLLLVSVISKKDENITLSDFSIQIKDESELVMIHGIAKSREDLIAFKQGLEGDKLWKVVDLPISDLGPAKNNQFSMTLTVAK